MGRAGGLHTRVGSPKPPSGTMTQCLRVKGAAFSGRQGRRPQAPSGAAEPTAPGSPKGGRAPHPRSQPTQLTPCTHGLPFPAVRGDHSPEALIATWQLSPGPLPRVLTRLPSSHFCQLGMRVHGLGAWWPWWSLTPLPQGSGESGGQGRGAAAGMERNRKPSRYQRPQLPTSPNTDPHPHSPLQLGHCRPTHSDHLASCPTGLSHQALWPARPAHPPAT